MKKLLLVLIASFALSACCDCSLDKLASTQINFFKVSQLFIADTKAKPSSVAFQITITDSLSAKRGRLSIANASLFNFRMEQCDCFKRLRISNPISKIEVYKVVNGERVGANISSQFTASFSDQTLSDDISGYRKIGQVLPVLKTLNYSLGSIGYLGLYNTSEEKIDNDSFLIVLNLEDKSVYELETPKITTSI